MTNGRITAIVLLCALTAPAAAQTGVLEKIRNAGAITMGYVEGAAPFSFVDENRQPQGYSIDLCREIANGIRAQLGVAKLETRWVALTLQNRLEAVRSGRVDIECSTTTWTLSRQKEVDFSLITFVDGGSILARGDADVGRLSDFGGKRIAVITGIYKLLDEDFSIEPYALALPRGDHEYRLAVNRVLARLYRTGDIETIYRRWLGKLGTPSLLLSAAYFIQGLAE